MSAGDGGLAIAGKRLALWVVSSTLGEDIPSSSNLIKPWTVAKALPMPQCFFGYGFTCSLWGDATWMVKQL